jgi:RNA polymerase sigma factor (sigma-70 family)
LESIHFGSPGSFAKVSGDAYKALADPELVAQCLSGDAQAWEALIFRYRRLIYSIPVKFNFIPADASDVFQAVCVKLIEHLHELKDETKVSAWLITTTTRQCIHVRAQRMRETSTDEDFDEPAASEVNVEDIQIQTQEQQNIRDAVRKLPDRCRRLLEFLYFETTSPSYEEIGRQMNMPVASIGPTRARCLEKLRTVFRRKGIQ